MEPTKLLALVLKQLVIQIRVCVICRGTFGSSRKIVTTTMTRLAQVKYTAVVGFGVISLNLEVHAVLFKRTGANGCWLCVKEL